MNESETSYGPFDPENSNRSNDKSRNADQSIKVVDDGIDTFVRPLCMNANPSIRSSFEPASNETLTNDLHSAKHDSPRVKTDAGIVISSNPLFKNAKSPIFVNCDGCSKHTDRRGEHFEKL
jgi:hypothetical protein